MTSAEITVYLYGVEVVRKAREMVEAGRGDETITEADIPDEIVQLSLRLGQETFAHWLCRGIIDADI